MSNGIESADVVKLSQRMWCTNKGGLLDCLPACGREGDGGVDSVLGRTTGACFPGKEKSSFLKN